MRRYVASALVALAALLLTLSATSSPQRVAAAKSPGCSRTHPCHPWVTVVPHPTPDVSQSPFARDPVRDCTVRASHLRSESLRKRLHDWLLGNIQIADSRLFTAPSGVPAKLGLLQLVVPEGKTGPGAAHYQAVLLGQQTVDGHLIIYLGFEDVACKHFFVPFNAGTLDDSQAALILVTRHRTALDAQDDDTRQTLSVSAAQASLAPLRLRAVLTSSYLDTSTYDMATLSADERLAVTLANQQLGIANALAGYLDKTSYFRPRKGLPAFSLINRMPVSFDPSTLPYLRDITVSG